MSLTRARAIELLDYCPISGVFKNRIFRHGLKSGVPCGGVDNGYLRIKIDGKLYRAHRVAWLIVYGEWPIGDHGQFRPLELRRAA